MNFPMSGSARRKQQQASVPAGLNPEVLRLRVEVRTLRDKVAAQEAQIEGLQRANEELYRRDYDRTGGPSLDASQPFGTEPPRALGTVAPALGTRSGGAL